MPSRPNIVLFTPDQLRADALGAFGNPVVQTPNHPMHQAFYFGRQGAEPRLDGDEATVQTAITFVEHAATSDVIDWDRDPRFPDIPHGWRRSG